MNENKDILGDGLTPTASEPAAPDPAEAHAEQLADERAAEQADAEEAAADIPNDNLTAAENAKPATIQEIRRFVDSTGRLVEMFTPYSADLLSVIGRADIRPKFTGNGIIQVNYNDGRTGQEPFRFPIEAKDIEQAFARFQTAADTAYQRFASERRKVELGLAGKVPLPKIVTPR